MTKLDGDQMQDLVNWLAGREGDIADGAEDFFELREIFFSLFGRNAGEHVGVNDILGGDMANVNELKQALAIAADALSIADDRNLPAVQVDPPKDWNLDGGGEDPADGWCSTRALSRKLRELAS